MMLKPLDIASFPLEGISLIEASAGTGKTWTITRLYARALLEQGLAVQQILVVTFTEAATEELKGRIREYLSGLLAWLEQTSRDGDEYLLFEQLIGDERAIEALRNALVDFDEASIYTIHGFCQRSLSSYPLETGSLLQQQLLEDEADLKLAVVRDFWRKEVTALPGEQLAWVLDNWRTPQVMLDAMKVLLENPQDLQVLLQANFNEQEILEYWIDEYRKVWDEQRFRDLHRGTDEQRLVQRRTAQNTIDQCCEWVNELFQGNLQGVGSTPWKWLRRSHLAEKKLLQTNIDWLDSPLLTIPDEITMAVDEYERARKRQYLLEAAQWTLKEIEQRKEHLMALSFDDLIGRLHDALTDGKVRLAERLCVDYPLALVDEFQDTDQRQFAIFRELYGGRPGCGLVMIGDPKQAIYGFRGGDVFTYQQARQQAFDQYTLRDNYRSRPALVDAVNRLFQVDQAFVFDELIQYQAVQAQRDDLQFDDPQGDEPLVVWREPPGDSPANVTDLEPRFAEYCANGIACLLSQPSIELNRDRDQAPRPLQSGDMAVLVQTHQQARLVQKALSRRGIPSALSSQESVFDSAEAEEMMCLLDSIIEPEHARIAVVLAGDLFGWNAQRIHSLQQDGESLIRQLEIFGEYHQLWRKQGLMAMMSRLLADQSSLSRLLALPLGDRQVTNWLQLTELLQQADSRHASPVETLGWLRQQIKGARDLSADSHQLQLESDRDLVSILTIHKSKGLEFPIVFLPFAWKARSITPPNCYITHDDQGARNVHVYDVSGNERWQQEQMAEQMRLFYVAVTRAMHRCYLGWALARGSEHTPIARLLYWDEEGNIELNAVNTEDTGTEALDSAWLRLDRNGGDKRVRIEDPPREARRIDLFAKENEEPPPPRELSRSLARQWRMSSYSRIVSNQADADTERAERSDPDLPEIEPNTLMKQENVRNRFSFPKGAKAGNLLHELLEEMDFGACPKEDWLQGKLHSHGYDREWSAMLQQWLDDIRRFDLGGHCLAKLAPEDCAREMEFLMSCDRFDDRALNELLHRSGYLRPERQLVFGEIEGYLQGFIDLVYKVDGRYFLLDYKSNHLGDEVQQYNEAACRAAMFDHDYHLQYLIYSLALHRYLDKILPDYLYERDFGGVRYLFLRGLSPGGTGLFSDRPAQTVIESLDRLLGGGSDEQA